MNGHKSNNHKTVTLAVAFSIATATLVIGILAGFVLAPDPLPPDPWQPDPWPPIGGTTNLDALTLSGDLIYDTDALQPVGFDGSTNYEIYFGSAATVTNTTVTAATHNMATAADWAICYPATPDDDVGDPLVCDASVSGTTATFQLLQDDGTNASNTDTIWYLIVGR